MGIYDRDYSREAAPGFQLAAPKSATVRLVLITFAAYVAQIMYPTAIEGNFTLHADWYRQPWTCYQLLTYGFLHSRDSVAHILINMLVLWMFGREIEQKYGSREFVAFYLVAIVAAGVAWSLSESAFGSQKELVGRIVVDQLGRPIGRIPAPGLLGASGGIAAVVALFALNFPHRQVLLYFFIPIPMWVAALIGLFFDMQGAMSRTGNVAFTAHLGGAFFGLLYYLGGWSITRMLPNKPSGGWPSRRPKLRVHEPDDEGDDLAQQVDAILQKIQEQGQDSLTPGERRLLERASEQYKQRRQ